MWWKGGGRVGPLAFGPASFPTPDTVLDCARAHVRTRGPLCLTHPNPVRSLLQIVTVGQTLGLGMYVPVVWSTPARTNPGERSMWALEVGLGLFGQGIPRYLECGPEGDWCGRRRPEFLTPWGGTSQNGAF